MEDLLNHLHILWLNCLIFFVLYFLFFYQLYLPTLWTRHTTGIYQSALWLCRGWAPSLFKNMNVVCLSSSCHRHGGNCLFVFFCLSLLTTFRLEKKSIKRSTTFTSESDLFLFPSLCLCQTCALPRVFCVVCTFVLFLEWIVCLICLFWFSFSHMLFLCSEQLQIFPVYSFLCSLRHSRVCSIQYISFAPLF